MISNKRLIVAFRLLPFGNRFSVGGVGITIIGCGTNGVHSISCTLGHLKMRTIVATSRTILHTTSGIVFPNIKRTRAAVSFLHTNNVSELVGRLHRPMLNVYLNVRLVYHRSRRKSISYLNVFSASIGHFVSRERRSGMPRVK